ncbi:MAG: hypothetical protein ABI356_12555 [Steroidobacteraceae bacterium]
MNKTALEGIGAARHASPLLVAESGAETGGGAGAGDGLGGAGAGAGLGAVGVVGVGVSAGDGVAAGAVDAVIEPACAAVESLEEPPPQPLSAATRDKSVSRANAPRAFEPFPIATCS